MSARNNNRTRKPNTSAKREGRTADRRGENRITRRYGEDYTHVELSSSTALHAQGRPLRVKGTEMLRSIRSAAAPEGTSQEYTTYEIAVNPGLRELGPRLSVMGELYNKYRIEKLRLTYAPTCAATTAGAIYLSYAANAGQKPPTGPAAAMAMESAIQVPVWQEAAMDVHATREEFVVRDLSIDYSQIQVYDNGIIFLLVPTTDPTLPTIPYGSLTIEYDIFLTGPAEQQFADEVAQRDEGWAYTNTFEERYAVPLGFPASVVESKDQVIPGTLAEGRNYWATGGEAFHSRVVDLTPDVPPIKIVQSTCVRPGIFNASSVNEFGDAPGTYNLLERGAVLYVSNETGPNALQSSVELPSLNYMTRQGAAIYNPSTQGTSVNAGQRAGRSAHFYMDSETAELAGLKEKLWRAGFGPVLLHHDEVTRRIRAGETVGAHELKGFPALLGQTFIWAPKVLSGIVAVSRLVLGINDAFNTWKQKLDMSSLDLGTSQEMKAVLDRLGIQKPPERRNWAAPGAAYLPIDAKRIEEIDESSNSTNGTTTA